MKRISFVCATALLMASCGGTDASVETTEAPAESTTTAAPTTTTTEATTTTTEAATTTVEEDFGAIREFDGDPVPEDLVGRWAHFDAVAYQGGDFKTLTLSYGFNDFSSADGEIIDSSSFCFSEQKSNQPIAVGSSDAATQAIKPPSTPLQVEVVDGALRIRRKATPTPVGIRLDDPANEPLPTDPTDPRIVDDDDDGNPGITVNIDAGSGIVGELYIARLAVFSFNAELTSPDVIEGTVLDQSEQLVIGASSDIFLGQSDLQPVTIPELNPIVLIRVNDDWDCERLAAEADTLFPTVPIVDW